MIIKKNKYILPIAGLIILGLVFIKWKPNDQNRVNEEISTISIKVGLGSTCCCFGCGYIEGLVIKYPNKLKINESKAISVEQYISSPPKFDFILEDVVMVLHDTVQTFEDTISEPRDTLMHDLSLKCFGSAFDISPDIEITKKRGTPTPLKWTWIITPQKEGRQLLIIDFEDLRLNSYKKRIEDGLEGDCCWHLFASIYMNDEEILLTKETDFIQQEFAIEVLTLEGMKTTHFTYLRYILILIGAFLMYPAISGLLTHKLSKDRNENIKE